MTEQPIQKKDDEDEVTAPSAPSSKSAVGTPRQYEIGPVGPPVIGAAAVDPGLPPRLEERMPALHWGAVMGLKPAALAAFASWAKTDGERLRTHAEWTEAHARFLRSPVR